MSAALQGVIFDSQSRSPTLNVQIAADTRDMARRDDRQCYIHHAGLYVQEAFVYP